MGISAHKFGLHDGKLGLLERGREVRFANTIATTVIVITIFMVIVPASVIQIILWIVSNEVQESLCKVGAVTGTCQSCQATWQIDIQLVRAGDGETSIGTGEKRDRVTTGSFKMTVFYNIIMGNT